jgi:hypothetical protein
MHVWLDLSLNKRRRRFENQIRLVRQSLYSLEYYFYFLRHKISTRFHKNLQQTMYSTVKIETIEQNTISTTNMQIGETISN